MGKLAAFLSVHRLLRRLQAAYRRAHGKEPTQLPGESGNTEGGENVAKILALLAGKKTHFIGWVSGLIGLAALTGWVPGLEAIDAKTALEMILGGFGLSALRAGVTKSSNGS